MALFENYLIPLTTVLSLDLNIFPNKVVFYFTTLLTGYIVYVILSLIPLREFLNDDHFDFVSLLKVSSEKLLREDRYDVFTVFKFKAPLIEPNTTPIDCPISFPISGLPILFYSTSNLPKRRP